MTSDEYVYELESMLSEQLDSDVFFDAVLRALDTDTKIDVFQYIARGFDIDVSELD